VKAVVLAALLIIGFGLIAARRILAVSGAATVEEDLNHRTGSR